MKKQSDNQYNANFDKIYSAALYMRISKDDAQTNDSTSIQTQEMILREYCLANGFRIYDTYKDDGYTGTNFDRPAFKRLINDIELGKVNLIITKDLSRLGRNYIETGYYIESYFIENNIRYIAIDDYVDTLTLNNDFMPFKNVINDMYSRDLSRKIKTAKHERAAKGLFISSNTPYGYKLHPENKNKLLIDEEPAKIVKLIFESFLDGKNRYEIANLLTEMEIVVPCVYKTLQGIKGFTSKRKGKNASCDYKWSYTTIGYILKNRMYTGDMVNHKTEVVNYKIKKLTKIPTEEYIIIENTHEAIISREDFLKAEKLLKERRRSCMKVENIFSGKIFCAACGTPMALGTRSIKSSGNTLKKKIYYRCSQRGRDSEKCIKYNYIYFDALYEQVLLALRRIISQAIKEETEFGSGLSLIQRIEREKALSEKTKIKKRLKDLTSMMRKLFEKSVLDLVEEDTYRELLRDYQQEQRTLNERLVTIDSELNSSKDFDKNMDELKSKIASFADFTELTVEMLNQLVQRIEIGYPIKLGNQTQQDINIYYKFINTTLSE